MSESIENRVKKKIGNYKRGKIFSPSDFTNLGSSTAIRQALNRLEEDGFLTRLAHVIYLYPKEHPILGELIPTTEEIALAIAKRDRARIIPTGNQALNKLGLSTQVPMNIVYLTDGSSRSIKINNGSAQKHNLPGVGRSLIAVFNLNSNIKVLINHHITLMIISRDT
ncbi:hypothetical protein SAMN05660903_03492 [Salegentibacter salinarum]|uniref:DUF6088 family protein n=1 Tax=Salegentibacter salinarum TaxID=447422 RepID=UPI0009D560AC|nr:DUF6088 family protein [Salegentibacter salinarum]SKB95854.1 hypothetical protein SAMN05660903_03492 [Salegentibacter salinarum]